MLILVPFGGLGGIFWCGLAMLALCWPINAIIVRTSLFPNLFRVPRMKYQKKQNIKRIKREVVAEIERMTPEERKNTNWSLYARDFLWSHKYFDMSRTELCKFIYVTLTKRGWR